MKFVYILYMDPTIPEDTFSLQKDNNLFAVLPDGTAMYNG